MSSEILFRGQTIRKVKKSGKLKLIEKAEGELKD